MDDELSKLDSLLEDYEIAKAKLGPARCRCNTRSRSKPIVQDMGDGFSRRVLMSPAYHCDLIELEPGSGDSHGIGSMRIWFQLVGPAGATQWMVSTDWYQSRDLDSVRDSDLKFHKKHGRWLHQPIDAWDIGYHAKTPQYEGQKATEDCELFDGPCYYDGSGLRAKDFLDGFLAEGPDYIWGVLKEEYDHRFNQLTEV